MNDDKLRNLGFGGQKPVANKTRERIAVNRAGGTPVRTAVAQPIAARTVASTSIQQSVVGSTSAGGANKAAGSSASAAKAHKAKAEKGNSKLWIIVAVVVAVCVIVGVVVAIMLTRGQGGEGGGESSDEQGSSVIEENSEEVQKITQETINKYAEVKVEGYMDVEDNPVTNKAVVVTVKNISDEVVSLAITLGAFDKDGNVLETSSVYAEQIQPGQTHKFDTFVYTELTPEQLNAADIKVYRANTYNVEGVEIENGAVEEGGTDVQSSDEASTEGEG